MKLLKILSGVVLISMLAVMPISASNQNSNATIEFTAGTGPTKPVDPENPDVPIDPEEPGVSGSLSIIYASDIAFEAGALSTQLKTYNTTTVRPNVQTVDLRGSADGWSLRAQVSPFTNSAGDELTNARVLLEPARMNSASDSEAPVSLAKELVAAKDAPPVEVVAADGSQGEGLWIARYYSENAEASNNFIQLEVLPNTAKKTSYSATITWSLVNAPA